MLGRILWAHVFENHPEHAAHEVLDIELVVDLEARPIVVSVLKGVDQCWEPATDLLNDLQLKGRDLFLRELLGQR